MKSLRAKLWLGAFASFALLAAMFFLSAGTLWFWQAWAYLGTTFTFWAFAVAYFYVHDPQLLERRMKQKEKVREQKLIMFSAYPVFAALYILPGVDHRLGWSRVPLWLTLIGLALVLAGQVITCWVLKYNSYASRIIEVAAGQKVVTTGPYAIVRHPMYLGLGLMSLAVPLALGSYYALPVGLLIIPFLMLRLLNEEKVLRQELPGYTEYCQRMRFRLIPYVW